MLQHSKHATQLATAMHAGRHAEVLKNTELDWGSKGGTDDGEELLTCRPASCRWCHPQQMQDLQHIAVSPCHTNSAWMQTHPHQLASNPNLTRWRHLLDVAALNASAINCGIAQHSPDNSTSFQPTAVSSCSDNLLPMATGLFTTASQQAFVLAGRGL